jgi:putative transposase
MPHLADCRLRRETHFVNYHRVLNRPTQVAFGSRCRAPGVRPSMGSAGDIYDNAMCESFFATLECELLARRRFASQAEARMVVFRYVEGWYAPARRHSATSYLAPIAYEIQMIKGTRTI